MTKIKDIKANLVILDGDDTVSGSIANAEAYVGTSDSPTNENSGWGKWNAFLATDSGLDGTSSPTVSAINNMDTNVTNMESFVTDAKITDIVSSVTTAKDSFTEGSIKVLYNALVSDYNTVVSEFNTLFDDATELSYESGVSIPSTPSAHVPSGNSLSRDIPALFDDVFGVEVPLEFSTHNILN